jgi:hypothetical protein
MRRFWSLFFAFSLLAVGLKAAPPVATSSGGAEGPPALTLGGNVVPEWGVRTALGTCANLAEARDACLNERFVPAFRWAVSGYEQKLDRGPRFQRVRASLLLERLVLSLKEKAPPVSEADLQKYYEANRSEFVKPERLRVFRILFAAEDMAKKVALDLPATVTLEQFRALARTHSIDHATHLRGGDLGFVGPDGKTDVPEVRVEPAIYTRASVLRDGEVLREPVSEGSNFALIWRRGSLRAEAKSLAEVSEMLRERLEFARGEEALKSLIETLRSKELHGYAPAKLEIYEATRKPTR